MPMINKLFVIIALITNCRVVVAFALPPPTPLINSIITNNNQQINPTTENSIKIHNHPITNYDSTLMNKTFLPFLNNCNTVAANTPELDVKNQILCSAYLEMVIEADAMKIPDFRTQDNVNQYLRNADNLSQSFCTQLPQQIPNRLPKFIANGNKTFHDVIANKQACELLCMELSLITFQPTVKPICLLISAGYDKIVSGEAANAAAAAATTNEKKLAEKSVVVKQDPEPLAAAAVPFTTKNSKPKVAEAIQPEITENEQLAKINAKKIDEALTPFAVKIDRTPSIQSKPEPDELAQSLIPKIPPVLPSFIEQSQHNNAVIPPQPTPAAAIAIASEKQPPVNVNADTNIDINQQPTAVDDDNKTPPAPIIDDANNNKPIEDINYGSDDSDMDGQDIDQQQQQQQKGEDGVAGKDMELVDVDDFGVGPQNTDDTEQAKTLNNNYPLHKDDFHINDNNNNVPSRRIQDSFLVGTDTNLPHRIQDPFLEGTDSNFFSYFMALMFICIVLYVAYHNKTKVIALVLEGRRSNSGRSGGNGSGIGRRKHSAAYRKLDTNLEEAITSNKCGRTAQIIY